MGVRGPGDEPSDVERALALFEDLEKQFDAVLEGQTGLVKRFDEFEARINMRFDQFEEVVHKGFKGVWDEFRKINQRSS